MSIISSLGCQAPPVGAPKEGAANSAGGRPLAAQPTTKWPAAGRKRATLFGRRVNSLSVSRSSGSVGRRRHSTVAKLGGGQFLVAMNHQPRPPPQPGGKPTARGLATGATGWRSAAHAQEMAPSVASRGITRLARVTKRSFRSVRFSLFLGMFSMWASPIAPVNCNASPSQAGTTSGGASSLGALLLCVICEPERHTDNDGLGAGVYLGAAHS